MLPLIIATLAFVTALLSGMFGMAGGLVLMAFLAVLLPVATAMMLHGALQATANGYRAWLNRNDIRWSIVGRYSAGAVAALALALAIAWIPSKRAVLLILGAIPFVASAMPARFALDVMRPGVAPVCGFFVTLLQLLAGVAGALLDVFFVRTTLTRHEVVATKAVTQTISHLIKLGFFFLLTQFDGAMLPWWLLLATLPLTVAGTNLGKMILDRMQDSQFRQYSKWLTWCIGAISLWRGFTLPA